MGRLSSLAHKVNFMINMWTCPQHFAYCFSGTWKSICLQGKPLDSVTDSSPSPDFYFYFKAP